MAVNINAAPYSADPTGVADATAILNQAIIDCSAGGSKAGQRLDLDGVYKISGAGLLMNAGNLHMRGAGPGTVLAHVAPSASAGTIVIATASLVTQIRIEDLTLNGGDGGPSATYAGIAVSGGGVKRIQVLRCLFSGYNGAGLRGAGVVDRGRFVDCEFTNINTSASTTNSSGSSITGSFTNCRFVRCEFHDTGCPVNTTGPSHCVYLNGTVRNNVIDDCVFMDITGTNGSCIETSSLGQPVNGINTTIRGCSFERLGCGAIQGVYTTGLYITGNEVYSQDGSGAIAVTYNCRGYVVANNLLYSKGSTTGQLVVIGVGADNHDGLICGNVLYNDDGNITGHYGVGMTATDNVTIRDNIIFGYCAAVAVYSVSQPGYPMKNITIERNSINAVPGAPRYFPHGDVLIASYGIACAGVVINGVCDNVRVLDNLVQNVDAELAFTNGSGGVGIATNLLFRSPYANGDGLGTLVCPGYPEYPNLPAGMKVLANVLSKNAPYQYTVPLGANAPLPGTQGATLLDSDLCIRFSNNQPRLSFVQGEDRTVAIVVSDKNTGEPIDLTSTVMQLSIPRNNGGTIKRNSAPIKVLSTQVAAGAPGTVAMTSHGLVGGDPVTVAPNSASTLPAGLAISTPYLVAVIDNNTFSFTDAGGVPITLTTVGTGSFNITNTAADITVDVPTLGHAVLNLRALVSAAANDALAQDMQLGITVAGKTRIAVLKNALDVYAQADP